MGSAQRRHRALCSPSFKNVSMIWNPSQDISLSSIYYFIYLFIYISMDSQIFKCIYWVMIQHCCIYFLAKALYLWLLRTFTLPLTTKSFLNWSPHLFDVVLKNLERRRMHTTCGVGGFRVISCSGTKMPQAHFTCFLAWCYNQSFSKGVLDLFTGCAHDYCYHSIVDLIFLLPHLINNVPNAPHC